MLECLINLLDSYEVPFLIGSFLVFCRNHYTVCTLSNCIYNLIAVVDLELLVADDAGLPLCLFVTIGLVGLDNVLPKLGLHW